MAVTLALRITLTTGRLRLRGVLHARLIRRPPLRRLGRVLRRLQTNVVPKPLARSVLLPFPARTVCRLFAAQQLDQGH